MLSGVLAGLGMGCKYTAVILPLAAAFVILLWRPPSVGPRSSAAALWPRVHAKHVSGGGRLRDAVGPGASRGARPADSSASALWPPGVFLLMAFIVFSPWLLKNFLFTGSPIYPLFIPASEMDALRQNFYNRPELAERNPLWAALIFFRAVLAGIQDGNEYGATLNPLLAFLPLALALGWRMLAPEVRREASPVAGFILIAYVVWSALTLVTPLAEQARLFYALFPALAVLSVSGFLALSALDTPALRPSFILTASFGLVMSLVVFELGADFARHNPLAYLLGQQSAADYRRDNLGWYAVAIEKVNALPADSRALFLWEARSLDCDPLTRCAPDVIIDRWWHLRRTIGSADAALARWQTQGLTHVLIYDTGVRFIQAQPDNGYVPADWTELDALRGRLQWVEQIGDTYSLYKLP